MWRIRLQDGSELTADIITCEGGALRLARRLPDGQISDFQLVHPDQWIRAERGSGYSK
jgi:hypothetical protein